MISSEIKRKEIKYPCLMYKQNIASKTIVLMTAKNCGTCIENEYLPSIGQYLNDWNDSFKYFDEKITLRNSGEEKLPYIVFDNCDFCSVVTFWLRVKKRKYIKLCGYGPYGAGGVTYTQDLSESYFHGSITLENGPDGIISTVNEEEKPSKRPAWVYELFGLNEEEESIPLSFRAGIGPYGPPVDFWLKVAQKTEKKEDPVLCTRHCNCFSYLTKQDINVCSYDGVHEIKEGWKCPYPEYHKEAKEPTTKSNGIKLDRDYVPKALSENEWELEQLKEHVKKIESFIKLCFTDRWNNHEAYLNTCKFSSSNSEEAKKGK